MMKRYEFINHTADIGIKVRGKTLPELFVNAAYAMFDILLDIGQVEFRHSLRIKIPEGEIEDIFVDWLRELLSRFNTEQWAFGEFDLSLIHI